MEPPKNLDFSHDITLCHPYLQERWPHLLEDFQKVTGHDLIITCTWRSVGEQQKLYAQGRTVPGKIVTQIDGVTKKSLHNLFPARALDVAVNLNQDVSKKLITWEDDYYFPLGPICYRLGLEWGGSWEHFKDLPHIQVPAKVS